MSMSVNKNFTVNYPTNKMIQNVADYKVVHEQFLDSKTTLDNHIAECPVLLAVMIKMPWVRDPAKDLSSEEVKRVKLCSVNDGMVDAADTKNIMVKMDMVL